MVNQYSAADFTNVPRTYHDTGEAAIGTSGTAPGNFNFSASSPAGTNSNLVTGSTYPHATGSYAAGEYLPTDNGPVSGVYAPGSGVNVYGELRVVYAEGASIRKVVLPGYLDGNPIASGIDMVNFTITQYENPSTLNNDPFLQSDV